MPSFGAKNPYFCKIKEEPEGTLPVYEGDPVKIGRLVKADLTIQMASGKIFADDGLAEIEIKADSICVHGDNPSALEFVSNIRTELQKNGVEICNLDAIV